MKYRTVKKILKRITLLKSKCDNPKLPYSRSKCEDAWLFRCDCQKLSKCIKAYEAKHPRPYKVYIECPKGNLLLWGYVVDEKAARFRLNYLVKHGVFYSFVIEPNK